MAREQIYQHFEVSIRETGPESLSIFGEDFKIEGNGDGV